MAPSWQNCATPIGKRSRGAGPRKSAIPRRGFTSFSRKSAVPPWSDRAPISYRGRSSTACGFDPGIVIPQFAAAVAGRAASFLLLLGAWEGAAWLAHSRLFPGAGAVLAMLVEEAVRGELLHHLGATLARF